MPAAGNNRIALKYTYGGFSNASVYSGQVAPNLAAAPGAVATGSDVLLFSGAGRLDLVLSHQSMTSGLPIVFYDAAVAVSGGPIAASGHRVVAIIPGQFNTGGGATVSGIGDLGQGGFAAGLPFRIGTVFTSGLCVNSRSGQPGFTVNWTSEELR